ncbi:hypothetical protein [Spirosoma harenae]
MIKIADKSLGFSFQEMPAWMLPFWGYTAILPHRVGNPFEPDDILILAEPAQDYRTAIGLAGVKTTQNMLRGI